MVSYPLPIGLSPQILHSSPPPSQFVEPTGFFCKFSDRIVRVESYHETTYNQSRHVVLVFPDRKGSLDVPFFVYRPCCLGTVFLSFCFIIYGIEVIKNVLGVALLKTRSSTLLILTFILLFFLISSFLLFCCVRSSVFPRTSSQIWCRL